MLGTKFRLHLPSLAFAFFACPYAAQAATYHYVDWTMASPTEGTAEGIIELPDDSTVTVTFTAEIMGNPGTFPGAQIDGTGTNYWSPDAPYLSAEVENAPPSTDILQLFGGDETTYIVTLSEPIKDPIMAIVSLGSPSIEMRYDFDSPFEIVSQGAGFWGGSDTALTKLDGDVLHGQEGHGTIRFIGTFETFSWIAPTTENWHGFTFGIRTTERLEPEPDAGAEGGSPAADAGAEDGGSVDGAPPADSGSGDAGSPTSSDAAATDATTEAATAMDGSTSGDGGSSGSSGGSGGAAGAPRGSGGSAESDAGMDGGGGTRASSSDDGGCSCRVGATSVGGTAWYGGMLLLAAAVLRRARPRR